MVIRPSRTSANMTLSTSQAKTWVKTHYERHEDGVVAKAVMYRHYEDFCKLEGRSTMETSIFGRVVKNVFTDVTIRRLGGRDNLKYYYCGIRAKESSPHAIDNKTTTRPKRRLRKRELVTNKTQVESCLRWLNANFQDSADASVVKTDVYERYITDCQSRRCEPLSTQYFGMVVTHAFPHVTKRKLGPRTNQQKYYFGISERPHPVPLANVPQEFLNLDISNPNHTSYREARTMPEDEEEEDFSCKSPSSDISDQNLAGFEPDEYQQHYGYPAFIKEEVEPVDYSLSSLRLKSEPAEEELTIKCDPSDIQMDRDYTERQTPERPLSAAANFEYMSPINVDKKSMPQKIYKPRFHFDYSEPSSWNNDDSRDEGQSYYFTGCDPTVTKWITTNLIRSPGVHLDRMQVYEKYCEMVEREAVDLKCFDDVMAKILGSVVTLRHPNGKTLYAGIGLRDCSLLIRTVEEFRNGSDHACWNPDDPPVDMSNVSSPSHSVPLSFEEEEEFQDASYPVEDERGSTEVLKDGKFYLRQWLEDNFAPVNDSCVLKAEAYKHYEIYARSIQQTPFEMNVFGKIVWQVFPDVTVRRLGGRSKPQYHYCGITVKPTSPLYQVMSGKDPAQRSRKKEIATDNVSAEIAIDWLRQNYENGKARIIAKSEVFNSYTKYCSSNNKPPVNVNYFGKLVKHCFAGVEVRKFGGRSDPTWCYYGLAPTEGSQADHQSDMNPRETVPYIMDLRNAHACAGAMSPGSPSSRGSPLQPQRSPTNPIPIADPRHSPHLLGGVMGNSFGSPTLFQDHLSPTSRMTSDRASPREYFDSHSRMSARPELHLPQGALSVGGSFLRDQRLRYHGRSPQEASDVPSELMLSRSPNESDSHGLIYNSSGVPREHLAKIVSHFGGQVVPSQTPPSLLQASNNDAALATAALMQMRNKKHLNSEMFVSFSENSE